MRTQYSYTHTHYCLQHTREKTKEFFSLLLNIHHILIYSILVITTHSSQLRLYKTFSPPSWFNIF